jgi:hypothetical protein
MAATTPPRVAQPRAGGAILRHMKVEEIAEAIAKLPPDQLARFRRWFTAFETGRTDYAEELDSTATKLGRLAGCFLSRCEDGAYLAPSHLLAKHDDRG